MSHPEMQEDSQSNTNLEARQVFRPHSGRGTTPDSKRHFGSPATCSRKSNTGDADVRVFFYIDDTFADYIFGLLQILCHCSTSTARFSVSSELVCGKSTFLQMQAKQSVQIRLVTVSSRSIVEEDSLSSPACHVASRSDDLTQATESSSRCTGTSIC